MEEDGVGLLIWGVLEVIAVAVWGETTDDDGTWRGGNGGALGAGGDFAVVADADAGLLAPDKRPRRTSRGGPQDGAFFGERLGLGRPGCGAQFAVDFALVGVDQELVEQPVGTGEFEDDEHRQTGMVTKFQRGLGRRRPDPPCGVGNSDSS